MSFASVLMSVAMSSCLSSLSFAFLSFTFHTSGPVSPALIALPGSPAAPPVLVVPIAHLTVAGRDAASPPVPVPMGPVTPVAVPLFPMLTFHVAQGHAAQAALHVGLCLLARLLTLRDYVSLVVMVVAVVDVGGAAVVVHVLPSVLLVQGQLPRLGLIGVVVAIVLRIDDQRTVQVGLHVPTSFAWV